MREKVISWLNFLRWGIRLDSVFFFLGYPLLGALFNLPDFSYGFLMKWLVFGFFNFLFLIQVFMFNDWGDFRLNPKEAKQRAHQALKYPELISEQEVLIFCLVLVLVSLVGIFLLSIRSGLMMILVWLINFLYSHPYFSLKRHPILPELAHFIGGGSYFLAGWGLFSGWNSTAGLFAGFFGMILLAGNFANQIDHFEEELGVGLRTSAIYFGKRPVLHFSLWLFLISSFYFLIPAFQLGDKLIILDGIFLVLAWLIIIFIARKGRFLKNISLYRKLIRLVYACFSLILILALVWKKIR